MRNKLAIILATGILSAFAVGATIRESGATSMKPVVAAPSFHLDGSNFKLDATPSDCKAGTECTIAVKIEALGEFHINKEYPYKITMNATDGVDFLGKGEKNKEGQPDVKIFSKASGDFVAQEKTAVMTVKFKPAKPGSFALKGTYKMSVCSTANCQLETKDIAVDVKAK